MSIVGDLSKPFSFQLDETKHQKIKNDLKNIAFESIDLDIAYKKLASEYDTLWKLSQELEGEYKRLEQLTNQVINEINELGNNPKVYFTKGLEKIEIAVINECSNLMQQEEVKSETQNVRAATELGDLAKQLKEYQEHRNKLVINLTGNEDTEFQEIDYKYVVIRGLCVAIILGIIEGLIGFDIFRYTSNSLTALALSFSIILIMIVASMFAAIGQANISHRKQVEKIFAKRYQSRQNIYLDEVDWQYTWMRGAGLSILGGITLLIFISRVGVSIFQMKNYSAVISTFVLTFITVTYFFVELFFTPKYPHDKYKQWKELEDKIKQLKSEQRNVSSNVINIESNMRNNDNAMEEKYNKRTEGYTKECEERMKKLCQRQHLVNTGQTNILALYIKCKAEYLNSCKEVYSFFAYKSQPKSVVDISDSAKEEILKNKIGSPFFSDENTENNKKIKEFDPNKYQGPLDIKAKPFKQLIEASKTSRT